MDNFPLAELQKIVERFDFSFIGFTVQPHIYSFLQRHRKLDFFGLNNDIFPTFFILNQPCEIVQWTNEKLMMRFVKRKDEQLVSNVSQQNPTKTARLVVENGRRFSRRTGRRKAARQIL